MEIITTHKNVDFDAMASVFAASIIYPSATPVLPKSLNPNTRAFISIHKDIFSYCTPDEISIENVTRLIAVDMNSWSRIEGLEGLKALANLDILLWDHHLDSGDLAPNWSCLEPVGATITLFVRKMEQEEISLTPIQATLFLAGIYEDTGNLTFPSTTPIDAAAVKFLLEQEADLGFLGSFLRPVYGPKQKDVLFEMLKKATRLHINGHTVSIINVHIDGHTPGLALVVNMFQNIMNVDAAFGVFSGMKQDHCMIIGRSADKQLDVGLIMRRMGGGGHLNAGSAMVKTKNPATVIKKILDLIQTNETSSVRISDLMSFPVITTAPDVPMRDVALLLRQTGYTGIPVVKEGSVVGIISRRDFKRMKKDAQIDLPVKAFMTTNVIFGYPGMTANKAAQLMVKNDIGRIPIIDGDKLIGIVTRSDIMRYYYDLLPSEISNENMNGFEFLIGGA